MNYSARIFLLLLLLTTACQNSDSVPASQIIDYSLQSQQHVIIVVEDNGVSKSKAMAVARKRAAQVTLDTGYQYFTILSASEVQVTKAGTAGDIKTPSNIYQELIMQKQFGREVPAGEPPYPDLYPAVRIVIECHQDKPLMGKSINAKEYLEEFAFLQG